MIDKAGAGGGKSRDGGALATALWDAIVFFAVILFSAFAVIVIAVAAPVAIAVSAIAGLISPRRHPRRWRDAHAN